MKKYVFISNSEKPSDEQQNSRGKVTISNFSRPSLQVALDLGYEVYLGINRANPEGLPCELNVHLYDSHTYRSIFDLKSNFIAYKNLMSLLQTGNFEVIHCNTPIGGLIGRLCGKKAKVKKVIYTAHGFHFYKGAPFVNRTLFKWVEQIMANWTDVIITMNQEDYRVAQTFRLRNKGRVYYIPGVGIDTGTFRNIEIDKERYKSKLGLTNNDIICIALGDLVKRKNYETSIKAIAKANNPHIHFFICGKGPELNNLQKLTRDLHVEKQIHFLGFRNDIKELLAISDIFFFTTLQEGLPRSMMEAMASGLPCIASEIRGNMDLIENGKGGYLRKPLDVDGFAEAINILMKDKKIRQSMGLDNLETIKKFDVENVKSVMKEIYEKELI